MPNNLPDDWGRFEGDATFGVGPCCDACGDPLSAHVCEECGELADCGNELCDECGYALEDEEREPDDE